MDKILIMPKRRVTRPKPMDEVVNGVLEELRALRADVERMQGDRANEKSSRPSESASSDVPEPVDDGQEPSTSTGRQGPTHPVPALGTSSALGQQEPMPPPQPQATTAGGVWPGENPQTGYVASAAATTGPAWSSASHIAAVRPVASSSLPLVDMVPEATRKDIQTGKDINLATLLLPARERASHMAAPREIKIGDETLLLKPIKDNRLSRPLTIQEFIKAFNIFKNVVCEQFPNRRQELDKYMSSMIDIATKYPGFSFYEYHLDFSARAAFYLQHHQIMIDWSLIDERLLTHIVAGRKANACSLCHSLDHEATFCHLAAEKSSQPQDFQQQGYTPCFKFNSPSGCPHRTCRYAHICSTCRSFSHSKPDCKAKQSKLSLHRK